MVRIAFVVAIVSTIFLAGTSYSAQNSARSSVQATRNGPVSRLIELERRKNEWLRQRFAR